MKKEYKKNIKRIITILLVLTMLTNITNVTSISNSIDDSSNSINIENENNLTNDLNETKTESENNEILDDTSDIDEIIENNSENNIQIDIENIDEIELNNKNFDEHEIDDENDINENEIDNGILYITEDSQIDSYEATYKEKTDSLYKLFQEAVKDSETITEGEILIKLNQNAVIPQQLEIGENQRVKINLNGYQIELDENAPVGKDRLFYVNGGQLEIVSNSNTAVLRGRKCSGDGGIIYVNKGTAYIETIKFFSESTNGKGKAIYIGENGSLTFGLTNHFKEIETVPLGTGFNDSDYVFIDDSKSDFIYINGTMTMGTKSQTTNAFDAVLLFDNGGYISIGDNAPDNGAIIIDSNYCGSPSTIKLQSTYYPRTVLRGISNSFQTFTSNDILYKCIINEDVVDMVYADEAKYGENIGTLKEMLELAFQQEGQQKVELCRDVEIDYQINLSNNDLRLDLKNHTLRRINNENIEDGRLFAINEGSKLEIVDGKLEGGKSIANGGAIYVGDGCTLYLSNIKKMENNTAKNGSAIYVGENATLQIRPNVNIYGNGENDVVIYSKSKNQIRYKANIYDGIFVVDNVNNLKTPMFEFISSEDNDPLLTINPIHIEAIKTPIVLTDNLSYGHQLLIPSDNYEIVDINGTAVLIEKGELQASYTSSNGDVINGSLKSMWGLANFYGEGIVTLLTDLTASADYGSKIPSHTEWEDGFYQMVTGTNANIVFDFNGHILNANMLSLINESSSTKAGTNFLFLVNDSSTLTLTDSVGSGGVKNIISGTDYPMLAYLSSKDENSSHLIIDNIKITDCYSGKGLFDSNNYLNDVIIKNNVIVKYNKKIISDELISASLSNEDLNLYINENSNVISEGLGMDSEIGINGDKEFFDKLVKLSTNEFADNFVSDNEKYVAIMYYGYVIFTNIERMDEVKYVDENNNVRTTSFDDAWERTQVFGGIITLLKDFSPHHTNYVYDTEKETIIELNGKTITSTATADENHFIAINKGNIKIIEDSKPNKKIETVTYTKTTTSSFDNNVLTYYTSYDKQTDDFKDETIKHIDNLSHIGGIKTIGYKDSSISVTSGEANLIIDGGIYTSDKSVFYLKSANNISNAYIIDSGKTNQDIIIFTRGYNKFENSVIVGNESNSGILLNTGILDIKNTIISNNVTNNNGTINNDVSGELNITNSYISYNTAKNGGAICVNNNEFSSNKNININNSYITNNKSNNGGGIYIAPYYEKSGNLDSIKLIRNINITNSFVISNEAENGFGGGLFLQSTTENSNIENCKIYKNISSKDGAGLYLYDTKINVKESDFAYNHASQNGGAIYYNGNTFIDIGEAWLENINANNNTAEKGSGAYIGLLRMHLMGNIDMTNNSDTGLYILKSMQVGVNYLIDGKIPFVSTDIPTREHNAIFAEANNAEKISEIFEKRIFINEDYDIITENTALYLKASINDEFKGVLVQYYSYLDDIANDRKSIQDNEEEKGIVDLSVIDTSSSYDGTPLDKAYIPHNMDTDKNVGWKYIWLVPLNDENNSVEIRRHQTLRMIFDDTDVNPNDIYVMGDIDRFTKNNESYTVKEVWVLKGNDYTSINPNDWEIFEWDPKQKFNFSRGTVIRLVCEQKIDENYQNDVIFYDYDITDGKYYTDPEFKNEMPSSTSEDYLKNNPEARIYVKTEAFGINDPLNYQGNGSKFAFGNANTGTKYKSEIWISPLKKNVFLNQANNAIGTVGGCAFRMIKSLDENGNLLWEDGIDAPLLYNEGEAIGKTVYTDKKLIFTKRGDTYTFTGVSWLNEEMKELDKFKFTSYNWNKTKKLYSNNFWPMDYVDSYGTDGHDIKFGYNVNSTEYASYAKRILFDSKNEMPTSDDSLPHNSYFGMHFSMSFEMPQGYSGPLEYWFFGDDEMFIFLDGQLICDIGGVHASIGEYINLWNYIEKGDTNKHTLSFYYTERGASGSTCWMQFTAPNVYSDTRIPTYSAYKFKKIDQYDTPISNVEFTLFLEDETQIEKAISDENGYITFNNLNKNYKYIVKETKTASDEYIISNDIYILEFIETEWIMYKQDDINQTKIESVVNFLSTTELPETGSINAIYVRNIVLAMITIGCLIFIIATIFKKKENYFYK